MTRISDVLTSRRTGSIVAALAAAGLLGSACSNENDTVAETTVDTPAEETATEAEDPAAAGGGDYADGTYEAQGSYLTPGGGQEVGVTITLADSVITDVEIETTDQDPTSRGFQEEFAGGIADIVVGKNIDDIEVSKVAGSSLTSNGFKSALETIRSEASS